MQMFLVFLPHDYFTINFHQHRSLIVLKYKIYLYYIPLVLHYSHAPEDTIHVMYDAKYIGFH